MNLKYTTVIALFFILISFTNSKAQCPDAKTIHSYTYSNTSNSKNNGEISVVVELNKALSFVVLDIINDNVINPIITKNNTSTSTIANFKGLSTGEYRIDVYSKDCPYTSKLSIGNPSIIIK